MRLERYMLINKDTDLLPPDHVLNEVNGKCVELLFMSEEDCKEYIEQHGLDNVEIRGVEVEFVYGHD